MITVPTTRLSDKFLLLDFLYGNGTCEKVRDEGKIDLSSNITEENLREGKQLCRNLLEPIVERFGSPISIGEGFRMEGIVEQYDKKGISPHGWTSSLGSAADIVVHDWVNDGKAPINFLFELSGKGIHYHRVISYAGSEYCCVAHKEAGKKYWLLERRLGYKGYKSNEKGFENWERRAKELPRDLGNWRREPFPHSWKSKKVRPWHVRVSRYFVLHDFCRNEKMFSRGIPTIPKLSDKAAKSEIKVARMMGEVLDPVKKLLGNLSVVRGWEPEGFAEDQDAARHRWIAGQGERHSVRFVTPVNPVAGYLDLLNGDNRVEAELIAEDLPCGGQLVRVSIEDFEPSRPWTSAFGMEFPWEAGA